MVVLESPTNRRPRMVSILGALATIKKDVSEHLSRTVVEEVCREVGHVWRSGPLDPANTVALFVRQVVQGNISLRSGASPGRRAVHGGGVLPGPPAPAAGGAAVAV